MLRCFPDDRTISQGHPGSFRRAHALSQLDVLDVFSKNRSSDATS
jgi:hypothetical protein